jgi:hypothetical protein
MQAHSGRIEAALVNVVAQIQKLADLHTVGITSNEHAQEVIAKARALHSEIGAGISAAELFTPATYRSKRTGDMQEYPAHTLHRTTVSIRAALRRANRRLFKNGYGPQLRAARTPREKEIGQWFLVENKFLKEAFNRERLEDYLREIGMLLPTEDIAETTAQ